MYRISAISWYIVLNNGSIKHVILEDCLYVSGLMKSLFSWSKLQSLNQYYLKYCRHMLVCKIENDNMICWARECLHIYLFNIPKRPF
jgi:hypothetical protein